MSFTDIKIGDAIDIASNIAGNDRRVNDFFK
jgi:hypothetical protein